MFHIDPATCGYIWPKTKGNTQVAALVANMLCEVSDELHSNEISIVRLKSSYHICFLNWLNTVLFYRITNEMLKASFCFDVLNDLKVKWK